MLVWPFNPIFPKTFDFPSIGTEAWFHLSVNPQKFLQESGCVETKVERLPETVDWPATWRAIQAANRINAASWKAAKGSGYSRINPGMWVMTLLGASERKATSLPRDGDTRLHLFRPEQFWSELNGWALFCVERELRFESAVSLTHCSQEEGKRRCERLHAYQQARYRYHEFQLEKLCERALGRAESSNPKRGDEAAACLLGWMSKRRGFAGHPLLKSFNQVIGGMEPKERARLTRFFDRERENLSRTSTRANVEEMGWIILAWPIWNFHGWRWVEITYEIILKFRIKTPKGKDRDFLGKQRPLLLNAWLEREDGDPDRFVRVFHELFPAPSDEEQEWMDQMRKRSDDRTTEELCRRSIGSLPLEPRPKGRPRAESLLTPPALSELARSMPSGNSVPENVTFFNGDRVNNRKAP